jgi:hypothetical protein
MAKLPPVTTCIFAEQVRPENGNKSTILGFMGVAPHAELAFQSFPALINLATMLLCEPVTEQGDFKLEVEVLSDKKTILPRTSVPALEVQGDGTRAICVINFQGLPIEGPGICSVVLYSAGELHSKNSFECKLGNVPQISRTTAHARDSGTGVLQGR